VLRDKKVVIVFVHFFVRRFAISTSASCSSRNSMPLKSASTDSNNHDEVAPSLASISFTGLVSFAFPLPAVKIKE
jgi:hypothetical protein